MFRSTVQSKNTVFVLQRYNGLPGPVRSPITVSAFDSIAKGLIE
jgi:hypothetical protein